MERARLAVRTLTTNQTSYQTLLELDISKDAQGISFLSLSIDPDPDALYKVIIAKVLNENDLELTAMWSVLFEHLTAGVYKGFDAGDTILIQHKTTNGLVTIKSAVTVALSEVLLN